MDVLVSNALILVLIFASGAICLFVPIEVYVRGFKPEKGDDRVWWGLLGFAFWVVGMWLWATT